MKINECISWERKIPELQKVLRIMKLTVSLLLLSVVSVFAGKSYSQTQVLNLDMKNSTVKEVLRNIEKIQNWNGDDINDIVDAVDVIKANGGDYDLAKNPKTIPDAFEDVSEVENIYAIDAEGNILYTDMSAGTVQAIRERRHREEIGLAPVDDLLDFLNGMQKDYNTMLSDELDRIGRRGNKTSARSQTYDEVVQVLDRVKSAVIDTAEKMEQALA